MRIARPNDHYDLYSRLMTLNLLGLFLVMPGVALVGHAKPVGRPQANIFARQNSDGSGKTGLKPSIWIPVLIAGLVLVGLILASWSNRKIRRLIVPGRATASTQAQGPRELTADELAGTINNGTPTANATTTQPAARTRRTRRPRRTPSQMSVTSLPEYNKEPGEQELVIFRGQDMEDVAIPADIPEEDGDSSMHSRDRSGSSMYSPVPHDSPSHEQDEDRLSRTGSHSRRESRTHNLPHSSEESHGLIQDEPQNIESILESRGEAPPYFEVVDPQQLQHETPTTGPVPIVDSVEQPTPPAANPSPPSSPERRSGIRTFFNRMSVVGAPRGLGHARLESNTSFISSNQSHGDPTSSASPSTSRHRPSPSTASSFFRTLSRQRSQSTLHSANASARLNSPSLISLNSISSPLTHTLTRTEFTYPKTGPTPEQLKIISSRESIARFGVPYGADARAFASSSMLDLTQPPPDFDTAIGASSSTLNLNAAASRVSLHVRGDSAGTRMTSPLAQAAHQDDTTEHPDLSSNAAQSQDGPSFSTSGLLPSSGDPQGASPSSDPNVAQASVASKASTMYKSLAPSTRSTYPAPIVSEFGKLAAPPPSSFNLDQTASSSRSESRASVFSYQSYATAAESVAIRGNAVSTAGESESGDEDGLEAPGVQTPVVSPKVEDLKSVMPTTQHGKEATDATITETPTTSNPLASVSSK